MATPIAALGAIFDTIVKGCHTVDVNVDSLYNVSVAGNIASRKLVKQALEDAGDLVKLNNDLAAIGIPGFPGAPTS